ncbi:hypothetical protein KY290_027539 [Solanum tuberosum]|uniref:F-box domain-containing protein n=1 Tax=Solanum tuberosum TaxID=4113 RepID=A0ABQ7UFG8_SOLTU|nr:hypothetical protein KY285_026475 [Solanum tuberosum]KAH0748307.1 hypothetical protein KY290_027539 [Solanum tuberosum]
MRICSTTASQTFEKRNHPSIEILPDECLFEVFKRLPSGQERSVCACVSKRWFMILSNIRKDEIAESNGIEGEGYLVSLADNARGCPTLRDLSLWNVSFVGDKGLSEIAHGCHLLEKLDLFQCQIITDKSLFDIAKNCPNMTSLTIHSCSNIGNESLKAVGQYCLNLKIVCPGVGNTTIDVVGGLCRKLTDIDLSGLLRITDEVLTPLVQNCSANLVEVNLSRCVNITDISVSTIVKLSGGSPKSLFIDGCRHVIDATLVEILKSCWMLNVFDVSKSGITDLGIKTLANAIQLHLRILSLSGCPFVLDNSLPFFLDLVQNLQGLNIQHCPRISSRTVDALVERNPSCDILS